MRRRHEEEQIEARIYTFDPAAEIALQHYLSTHCAIHVLAFSIKHSHDGWITETA